MARKQSNSRAARWERACAEASDALGRMRDAAAEVETALEALRDIQSEYQDWKDNLPDSLADSPVGEKLSAVVDLDLEWDAASDTADDAESKIDDATGADLPLGWGRD